ncbi:MAG: class I SAM-dependent methyltransferase [Oceanicoccus sp.]
MISDALSIAVKLDPERVHQCQCLAAELGVALVTAEDDYPYLLVYSEGGLSIQQTGKNSAGPVRVDFAAGAANHRRKHGGGELIVKAVAGNKQHLPSVFDATAGLGRDSFVLASRGYSLTMCERSPVVAAILQDGLDRARLSGDTDLEEITQRMTLFKGNALDYLQKLTETDVPDVIVIDPMFPESKKSALVKKEMRAFHYVVGADSDSHQLLEQALTTARHRVVVKRPKKSDHLGGLKPNFSIEGKAIRFDIYSLRAFGK